MNEMRKKVAIDPVCGAEVAPDAGLVSVHRGGRYRFCCSRCKSAFEQRPERYLAPERWWKRYLLKTVGAGGRPRGLRRN